MSVALGTPPDDPYYGLEKQFAADLRKKPLLFTVGLHLLSALLILFPPDFFSAHRNIEEIYTVDLFEAEDSGPAKKITAPPPPPKKIAPAPAKSVVTEQVKPITSTASVESTPGKVVSLKPRLTKKNIRKNKVTQQEQIKVNSALDRLKAQLDRREAEKRAAAAADDAVSKLRDLLHTTAPITAASAPAAPATGSASGQGTGSSTMAAALKRYYVTVSQQIHQYWVLPELQDWKADLQSVVVVHVRRDGIVTKQYFEQKSDNRFFNQFVEKTLHQSLPLPPFPADLHEQSLEIGLVFHPGGLM